MFASAQSHGARKRRVPDQLAVLGKNLIERVGQLWLPWGSASVSEIDMAVDKLHHAGHLPTGAVRHERHAVYEFGVSAQQPDVAGDLIASQNLLIEREVLLQGECALAVALQIIWCQAKGQESRVQRLDVKGVVVLDVDVPVEVLPL